MVTKLEAVLLANVGLKSVEFDGTKVAYADLEAKYDYWKARLAAEQGMKPRISTIDLRCS
jgi:hypothetical protein